jgi:ATP-dependent helicase HepA
MSPGTAGQRCVSEREPELGLGLVADVDSAAQRITVAFPARHERRVYALGTTVLRRVQFRPGEILADRAGARLTVESSSESQGLVTYHGQGLALREEEIADVTSVTLPQDRLLAGQADPGEVFDLRLRALTARSRWLQSDLRGCVGGRVQLIPHQFHILQEVASRHLPRVLLADEVGLGKTIEACLILHRLLAVSRVRRALVLVPEPLTHQWFVELLRRFNLWFSICDEDRCRAAERGAPGANPFLATQLALCALPFLTGDQHRREQALAAGWDLVIVDEAHHLGWTPEQPSPDYLLVEEFARHTPGLLLLTATPTQLGLTGHFARLRLLDPLRYEDFARFQAEAEGFQDVAQVADKLATGLALTADDHASLCRIFFRDPARLQELLGAVTRSAPGSRPELLRHLLDQYGPGRVIFRNTRAAIPGFPRREYHPITLGPDAPAALLARIAREVLAEEAGTADAVRYAFKDDPRLLWLAGFLLEVRPAKVLLLCRSQRKVIALAAALQERLNLKVALFHEGLPLVQRDRQAAWFAEPDGAQALLSSELGSEGRNFQFARHLILFDLPLDPGLLEQRIGRLDRIGRTEPVHLHVPTVRGSATEVLASWHHAGLGAFAQPITGGPECLDAFGPRILALATSRPNPAGLGLLLEKTRQFHADVTKRLRHGRDRLLELNSHQPAAAKTTVERIRNLDADPGLRGLLLALLDHFGVRVTEHEGGDVFLDPAHAYVESFPSLPAEGLLGTFDRQRALAREDLAWLTFDHPLTRDSLDLLLDGPAGTTAFGTLAAEEPGLLLEAVFVLEAVTGGAETERFLAPSPIRVVVDLHGKDQSADLSAAALAAAVEDSPLEPFLAQPGFDAHLLRRLTEAAGTTAATTAARLREAALERAQAGLKAEIRRLEDLRPLNDHVSQAEIDWARQRLADVRQAITQSRLRLDAIRLILAGPSA